MLRKTKLMKALSLLLAAICLLSVTSSPAFAAEPDSETVIAADLAEFFDAAIPHAGNDAASDATNYNYRVDKPVVGERIPLYMDMPAGVDYIFWYETDDYGTYQRLNPNYPAVYDAGRSYILVIITSSSAYSVTVNGNEPDRIEGGTMNFFYMGQPRTRGGGFSFWQMILKVLMFITFPIRWLLGL